MIRSIGNRPWRHSSIRARKEHVGDALALDDPAQRPSHRQHQVDVERHLGAERRRADQAADAARAGAVDRLLQDRRDAGGVDAEVGADAAGRRPHSLDRIRRPRIDTCVAPTSEASSSRDGRTSTPMIVVHPATRAAIDRRRVRPCRSRTSRCSSRPRVGTPAGPRRRRSGSRTRTGRRSRAARPDRAAPRCARWRRRTWRSSTGRRSASGSAARPRERRRPVWPARPEVATRRSRGTPTARRPGTCGHDPHEP